MLNIYQKSWNNPTTRFEPGFCRRPLSSALSAEDGYTSGLPSKRPFSLQSLPSACIINLHHQYQWYQRKQGIKENITMTSGNLVIIVMFPFGSIIYCYTRVSTSYVMRRREIRPVHVRFMTSAFWFLSLLQKSGLLCCFLQLEQKKI